MPVTISTEDKKALLLLRMFLFFYFKVCLKLFLIHFYPQIPVRSLFEDLQMKRYYFIREKGGKSEFGFEAERLKVRSAAKRMFELLIPFFLMKA